MTVPVPGRAGDSHRPSVQGPAMRRVSREDAKAAREGAGVWTQFCVFWLTEPSRFWGASRKTVSPSATGASLADFLAPGDCGVRCDGRARTSQSSAPASRKMYRRALLARGIGYPHQAARRSKEGRDAARRVISINPSFSSQSSRLPASRLVLLDDRAQTTTVCYVMTRPKTCHRAIVPCIEDVGSCPLTSRSRTGGRHNGALQKQPSGHLR